MLMTDTYPSGAHGANAMATSSANLLENDVESFSERVRGSQLLDLH